MLISKLLTLGALSVLISGLTACSADKKSDTWSVDAPQISIRSGSQIGFIDKSAPQTIDHEWSPSLREMSHRVLPSDAVIDFPSLKSTDAAFDMVVTSDCKSGDLHAAETKVFHQTANFSLLATIPTNLTVTTLSRDTFYTCALNLTVRNAIGSTINFSLPTVYIQNLDQVASFDVETFDTHQLLSTSVPTINYADAHLYVARPASKSVPSQVQLTCDFNSKAKTYSDISEFHLDDLLPKDNAESGLWKQNCRLIITPIEHAESPRLSRRFILTKDLPALTIKRILIDCGSFLNRTAMRFEIQNPTGAKQMIGLHIPKRIHLMKFYGNLEVSAPLVDSALITTVADTETVVDSENNIWFEVGASEKKSIEVSIDQDYPSQTCPGTDILTSIQLVDTHIPWWPLANLNASVTEKLNHIASNWAGGTAAQVIQTGHYDSLNDIKNKAIIATDNATAYPIATVSDSAQVDLVALAGSKQSTY